jgi:alkaline phosphatase
VRLPTLRAPNKNAPLPRMAAIASAFVFGQKVAQRAAEGMSPCLFSLHPRRCRFRSSSLRGSFLLGTLTLSNVSYLACATVLLLTGCAAFSVPPQEKKPRNIILVIGDGMGPQQLGLAELYALNTKDRKAEPLSRFVRSAAIGTHIPSAHNTLVNDSACSATQMASACTCKPRQVGIDTSGLPCGSIFQDARRRSMKVGLVSDTQITHATPAAFYASVHERNSEHRIAEQLIKSDFDLALSGGRAFFSSSTISCETADCRDSNKISSGRSDDQNLIDKARSKGVVVVESASELRDVRSTPLLGLFSQNFMNDAFREGQDEQPSLAAMTAKALSLLDNQNGFILMVEAGQIDFAAHNNDAGWVLAELLRLSTTLDAIMEFTQGRDDTLVILTGDHETGGMGFSYYYPSKIPSTAGLSSSPGKGLDSNFVSTESLDTLQKQTAPIRTVAEAFMKLEAKQRTAEKLREMTRSIANLPLDLSVASWITTSLSGETRPRSIFDALVTPYYPHSSAPTALLGRALGSQLGIVWATGTHTSTPIFVFSTGPYSSSFQGVFQTHELGQRLKAVLE